MSILVTGGSGLIGSNTARLLAEQGREVVVYDLIPLSGLHVLNDVLDEIHLEIGNVMDLSHLLRVIKRWNVQGIIHCAALLGVPSNQRPIEALQTNIIGTANVLEAARILDLRRIIVFSSSSVMGPIEDLSTPSGEEKIRLPLSSIYSITKLTCEQLAFSYRQLHKVDVLVLRPAGVFGPGAIRPLQPINQVMQAVIGQGPIRYETGGDSEFEFTYVKDFAQGTIQAYDCLTPRHYLYNLSFGKKQKMSKVFDVLKNLFPHRAIEIGPGFWEGVLSKGEQTDTTYRIAQRPPQDITRARQDFRFAPEWDLDRSIPDWLRWLKEGKYS